MNILIVDDNKIARTTLAHLAGKMNDVTVVGECASAMQAYNALKANETDAIFLDVEMPDMSGIELTRNLGKDSPLIVFVTSKKDYALEAFDLNVADYLLKPITPARFVQAVDKVRQVLESRSEQLDMQDDEFVFVRDSGVVRKLKMDEIHYVEAMGDYVKFFVGNRFYTAHTTLKNVEARLAAAKFLRIHRSFIVAISKIDSLQDGLIMIGGKPLPVADAYRSVLNKRLNIL